MRSNIGNNSDSTNMTTNDSNSAASTTSTKTNHVSIRDFAFGLANITVIKGTAVTWANNDPTTHTVTENDGQTGPASSQLTPGLSYSFAFDAAGTFIYHCAIHPDMTGTVIVTE